MSEIKTQYSDGGRSQAPDKYKDTNSCTVNALANTADIPYDVAFKICEAAGRAKNKGFWPKRIMLEAKKYGIASKKFKFRSITLQKFVKKYPTGKFYVSTSRHSFAIIDGVVMDWIGKRNSEKCRLVEAYEISGTYNGEEIKSRQKKLSTKRMYSWMKR